MESSYMEVPPAHEEMAIKKNEYPSKTTEEYFKDWDSVVLEGNPELKDTIKRNIVEAEKKNEKLYSFIARNEGISIEELKSRLQSKVESLVNSSNFFRATHIAVLERVLNVDGRYKSQFETGISNGRLDPTLRAATEVFMFGFNVNQFSEEDLEDPEYFLEYGLRETKRNGFYDYNDKRPIYGYFSDDEHGVINEEGTIPPPNRLSNYGPVTVKFNKECVIGKSTIAFQDTLSKDIRLRVASPSQKPHFTSMSLLDLGYVRDRKKIASRANKTSKTDWGADYTETQYHNQLTTYDIEAIYISKNSMMSTDDMNKVRDIFRRFKESNPESTIELIEY